MILLISFGMQVDPTACSAEEPIELPKSIQSILTQSCLDCHSGDSAEGNARLDNIVGQSFAKQIDLLNRVQDQIFFGLMPPEDAGPLKTDDKTELAGWLRGELKKHNASRLDENFVSPRMATTWITKRCSMDP